MLDAVLAAVADPTRRAMIQRLAHGPATTGQLAALVPISRPAVSQHLRLLRDAGLVRAASDRRGAPNELVAEQLVAGRALGARPGAAIESDERGGAAMIQPASYVEINSPDPAASERYVTDPAGVLLGRHEYDPDA